MIPKADHNVNVIVDGPLRFVSGVLLSFVFLGPILALGEEPAEAPVETPPAWVVDGTAARTATNVKGIEVSVDYFGVCKSAAFNLHGHDNVGESALIVDDEASESLTFERVATGRAAFILTDTWVRKLANGQVASLVTSKGTVHFTLDGSGEAFAAAKTACYHRALAPLQPQPTGFVNL
jgi:hypothetical protein